MFGVVGECRAGVVDCAVDVCGACAGVGAGYAEVGEDGSGVVEGCAGGIWAVYGSSCAG